MNFPLSSESASAPVSVQLVDCWNKIGIWGDQGCAKLETAIHCRNCAVYSAAASQLLDADIPADYLQRWTKHFAKAKSTNTGQTRTLFLFRIGVEWLALSPVVLQEITTQKPVHSVPHRRNNVLLGVVNIGG
ncbi:MAG: cheW, partial [Verrucomicrobiales bacterium]|nr:cheW [Verrucomicrobiales bacterium]